MPIAQTYASFAGIKESDQPVIPSVRTGVAAGEIAEVLPPFAVEAIKEGIVQMDRRLHGFADPGAMLIAPETRSSSPVRILRDDTGAANIGGVYPCGEGAGYAGGITSAAVDGLKTAERIICRLNREI